MVGFSSPECSKLSFPGRTAGQQGQQCHRGVSQEHEGGSVITLGLSVSMGSTAVLSCLPWVCSGVPG